MCTLYESYAFLIHMSIIWIYEMSFVHLASFFTDCIKKNFNIGMHSDAYRSIWIEFALIIEAIVFYVWILL